MNLQDALHVPNPFAVRLFIAELGTLAFDAENSGQSALALPLTVDSTDGLVTEVAPPLSRPIARTRPCPASP